MSSNGPLDGRPDGDDIVDEMLSLGSVIRLDDGTVADPSTPLSRRPSSRSLPLTGEPGMKFGIFYEHQLPRPWDRVQRATADRRRPRPDRAG